MPFWRAACCFDCGCLTTNGCFVDDDPLGFDDSGRAAGFFAAGVAEVGGDFLAGPWTAFFNEAEADFFDLAETAGAVRVDADFLARADVPA